MLGKDGVLGEGKPRFRVEGCPSPKNLKEKDVERKSILEYIKNQTSTSDFTQKIHQIVERTKANQAFRGEYMAWGLAEQDAEKRGYKAGITDGIMQGISQGAEQAKIETAQNLLAMGLSLDNIAKATGLSVETLKKLATGENILAPLPR